MTSPRAALDQIIEAITSASGAQAEAARQRISARTGPRESLGSIERLAEQLAGARHAPRPDVTRKIIAVCAADHGVADPGVDLGANNPTIVALQLVCDGGAAVNAAARSIGARIMPIDCGVRGGAGAFGPGVLDMRVCDGTADMRRGGAMTPPQALAALQTGIAVVLSLADDGLDLLALGHVGAGGATVSGAVIAALTGSATAFGDEDREAIAEALATNVPGQLPLEVLAALGGPDLGVMAGMILAAAAINVPVVLDDHATWAAALLAARFAPAVSGYLIASHAGASPPHRRALDDLGLVPLFDLGLSHGEGTGAALALPFVDAAARLLGGEPHAA